MGFDSKHDFAPPTILLGLLCPWTWDISSQSLQHHAATTLAKFPVGVSKFPLDSQLGCPQVLKINKPNTELTISSHFPQNQNKTNQNTTCSASQFSYLQYTTIKQYLIISAPFHHHIQKLSKYCDFTS